uniref:RNase H type-1 domain-containing protein n=1 Tax=Amphimedon queenslandica TaxID=400682 RepID=A0A1X7U5U1_AMPQE
MVSVVSRIFDFIGIASPVTIQAKLCGFSDTSSKTYAAVIYLQQAYNGKKRAILIASTSQIVPMNRLSIVCLEFLGALLSSMLIHSVEKALKTDINLLSTICYSDSEVMLNWVRGENRDGKPFAQNRVREIRSLLPAARWRHCPGQKNPVDFPTRSVSVKELKKTWWFRGPPWIGKDLIEDPSGEMPSE